MKIVNTYKIDNLITIFDRNNRKGIVRKGNIGKKKGWCFVVFYDDREYPNIISALYKTQKETKKKLLDYLFYDKLDTFGSAESKRGS